MKGLLISRIFFVKCITGKQIRQDLAPWNITNPVISIDITGLLVGISVLIDIVMLIYNTYLADGVGVKIWQKKHQKEALVFGGKDNINEPIDDAKQRYDYIEMKMIISIII